MASPVSSEDLPAFNEKVSLLLSDFDNVMIVDLRGVEEIKNANDAINGSVNIVWDMPNATMDTSVLPEEKEKNIILYCRSGKRAGFAKEFLEARGYSNVMNAYTPQMLRSACPDLNL